MAQGQSANAATDPEPDPEPDRDPSPTPGERATNPGASTSPPPPPPPSSSPRPASRARLGAALAGIAAFLAVVATLGDPGITVDEPLDVRPGRAYLELLASQGRDFLRPDVIERAYADNKEHPPLGRWLLGLASVAGEPFERVLRGPDPVGIYTRSGRLAPAAAFGLLVFLVVRQAAAFGSAAAWAAAIALPAMPRLWSHAHLGALDMMIATFWLAALFAWDAATRGPAGARGALRAAAAGCVWALALLTKIHAWLLIPLAWAWAAWRRGPIRGSALWTVWLVSGLALFLLGWPWLWADPLGRLRDYLATGADRVSILTIHFGTVHRDKDVPWHYPWVHFLSSVPISIHAFAAIGVFAAARGRTPSANPNPNANAPDPRPVLWGAAILGWLLLFSLVAPVYDGDRLYLMVFPLWALFAALGFQACWNRSKTGRSPRALRGVLALLLAVAPLNTLASHPTGLSWFNALPGGVQGAARLGLEVAYWTEAVDDRLLAELERLVEPGDTVALVPSLAPGQGRVLTTRGLLERGIVIEDDTAADSADWWIVLRRPAYWSESARARVETQAPVFTRSLDGVWLAGIWRGPAASGESGDSVDGAR